MSTHAESSHAALPLIRVNGQTLACHEVPALKQTARDALEDRYVGMLSAWMLGAGLVGVLAGAGLYFLALSPYVIRVLGPVLEIPG